MFEIKIKLHAFVIPINTIVANVCFNYIYI
jgi:hypothetical protein